jgi:putative transposase
VTHDPFIPSVDEILTIHAMQLARNLATYAVSSTVSACGEEGSGRARKSAVKPASVKQEASSRFSQL